MQQESEAAYIPIPEGRGFMPLFNNFATSCHEVKQEVLHNKKRGAQQIRCAPLFLLSKSYSGNSVVVQKIFQFFAFTGLIVI